MKCVFFCSAQTVTLGPVGSADKGASIAKRGRPWGYVRGIVTDSCEGLILMLFPTLQRIGHGDMEANVRRSEAQRPRTKHCLALGGKLGQRKFLFLNQILDECRES